MTAERHPPRQDDPADTSSGVTRRFVIGFAIVEAIVIGWALFSGRIG